MQKKLIIIKLGGSVITEKETNKPRVRLKVINHLSSQIAKLYRSNKYKIILIHGAGSFAHPLAKKYGLKNGMQTQDQNLGFSLTDFKMQKLNSIILKSLINLKIPATTLSPHSFVLNSSGVIKNFDHSLIENYLSVSQVPVLHGDVVLDDKQRCSILSGDAIATYLAKKLDADRIIFVSDVDGIFDSDPKRNADANLISKVNSKNYSQVLKGLTSNNEHDLTGEMAGKLLTIRKMLSKVEVHIINGFKQNTLLLTLSGQKIGTRIRF